MFLDEASYLREWIEFHRLVGVERFFLYDHESVDDSREVLAPYIEDGTVVLHHWPVHPGQLEAIDDCLERHRSDSRWIAFIDLDEFLFSGSGRPVSEILRDFEDFPGVVVNEAHFYTSGHRQRPPGLVIENYLTRDLNPEMWVKSIVDPARTLRTINAHLFKYDDGFGVDMDKHPVTEWPAESLRLRPLRINHYYTKSEEEYLKRWSRPRADTGETRVPLELERLRRIDARSKRDDRILDYLEPLKAALKEASDDADPESKRGLAEFRERSAEEES